jgi:DNA-binding transcriptional ArsR family regulator
MSEWLEADDLIDLKKMLRALADVARLNIVHHLADQREVNVTEICQSLGISQPLVSWHLAMLRRAELVRTRRLGRQVYCSLDLPRFRLCQHWLAQIIEPDAGELEQANQNLHTEPAQPQHT